MKKPIPYKAPVEKKKIKLDNSKIKKIVLFILAELFLIILSVTLVAVISILFSINMLIVSIFMAIFLSLLSAYVAIKFFKK